MCERTLRRGGGGGGGDGGGGIRSCCHNMATLLFCLLMLISRTQASQVVEATEMTCDQDAPATYTAAVVEYSPELGVTEENVAQRFKDNIKAYKEFINSAKKEGVDIIVFPECGLATLELPRLGDGSPAVSVDVSNIGTNPCIEEDIFHQQEMRDLSCAARDAGVYVVVNLPEQESCSPALAFCPECPGFDPSSVPSGVVACNVKGLRYFNTDVAFDRKGTVIARYRKFNLFGEPGFVAPAKVELSTFMTDFGVRFGIFTCFDLMFERPAVELVAETGITDLIFPTAWFSELPFLTAIQAQAAWSWVLDVNMLAAGYNLPSVGSTGTGLHAGRQGIVAATMERTRTSKMLVGKMPNARSCKKSDIDVTLSGRTISLKAYETGAGSNNFLGGQKPPKMEVTKKAKELPKRKVSIPSLYKCHLESLLQMEAGRHIVRTDTGEATDDETSDKEHGKVELMYKRKQDLDGDDEQELQADEAEFREALASRPDGNSKLLQGNRYKLYLKELMLARLRGKSDTVTSGSPAVKGEEKTENIRENSDNGETETKRFKKRRKPLDMDDLIFGKRKLQQKSEKKKKDEDDHEPSIEEIALTMLSGLEEGGDKGEQLKDMVEKLQEDQEKSKLTSKPTPSIDEMEGTLLGALRELSGNMTAEEDILNDVMMDLQDSDQREAAEKKFILERCQRILMDINEQDEREGGAEKSDYDSDEGEALKILTEEPLTDGSMETPSESRQEDEEKANNEVRVNMNEPEIKKEDKEVKVNKTPKILSPENLEKTEKSFTDAELKNAEIVVPEPDDNILPQDDDTGESTDEMQPPIEETLVPDTPAMDGPVGEKIPSQEDELGQENEGPQEGAEAQEEGEDTQEEEEDTQEEEGKQEDAETQCGDGTQDEEVLESEETEEDEGVEEEECDDETCPSSKAEGDISSTETSMPDSTDLEPSTKTEPPMEPDVPPFADKPLPPKKTMPKGKKTKFIPPDVSHKQPTKKEREAECSNYVTPEKIYVSKAKSSFGHTAEEGTSKESESDLYFKTEDLQNYASLLLTTESIIENSTVTVCHGIFCCHFSVTIHPAFLPSHTGYKSISQGVSAHRDDLIPLVKDESHFLAQHPEEHKKLIGNKRGYYRTSYLVNKEDDDEEDDFAEDKEKGKKDDDDLSGIDLSEMTPDEYDDDDSDIDRDIHEGPVFLQSAVLQTLQAGESMGSGSLTQEDMEPSEHIIEQEKKVKEREMKAISDGLVEEPTPHIPHPEPMKKEEELGAKKKGESEVKKIREVLEKQETETSTEEVSKVEDVKGEDKPPVVVQDKVTGRDGKKPLKEEAVKREVSETSEEKEEEVKEQETEEEEEEKMLREVEEKIPTELGQEEPSEEEGQEEEVESSEDVGRDVILKEQEVAQKDVEKFSVSGKCDCVDCWEGRDEALEESDEEREVQEMIEEPEEQEPVEDEENVEEEAGTVQRVGWKKRKRESKRYYYRLVVYNGLRSFDGVADGGLQVCAVVSCTGLSSETCGKLHNEDEKVLPTNFDQVAIRGNFRRNRALPMPTTLGMDMMPLPARSFSLKVVPVAEEGVSELTMETLVETEFLSFGIYSRDFLQDPPRE